MKKDFHKEVANDLIKQLENGTAPWQKSWNDQQSSLPYNANSNHRYQGTNVLVLLSRGYDDPRWLTYKQAQEMGLNVRKGERGTPIQFYVTEGKETVVDKNGNPVLDEKGKVKKETVQYESPRPKTHYVFNAQQIEGLEPLPHQAYTPEQRAENIRIAQETLQNSGAVIEHVLQDKAYYSPKADKIVLPTLDQFETPDQYYGRALHELGHWTGHESRLNRDLRVNFYSPEYAREELRAEINSMFLEMELGIPHDVERHANYVDSWIKELKKNPHEIFNAAKDAQEMKDFILQFAPDRVKEQTQASEVAPEAESATKIYLTVPYEEKGAVKELGAKWDRDQKSWYYTDPDKADLFRKWEKVEEKAVEVTTEPTTPKQTVTTPTGEKPDSTFIRKEDRVYLDVPYKDKNMAKGLGAMWDKTQKSWYISNAADRKPFDRWLQQPKPEIDPNDIASILAGNYNRFPEPEEPAIPENAPLNTEPDGLGDHYRMTSNSTKLGDKTLYQVEAIRDFQLSNGQTITAGTRGGFIEKPSNLAQDTHAWVQEDEYVSGNYVQTASGLVVPDKYIILKDQPRPDPRVPSGVLYPIQANRDFYNTIGGEVREGDMGGYVEGEHNLSQEGSCWIKQGSIVGGNVTIKDTAVVEKESSVIGNNITLSGRTSVYDSHVLGNDITMHDSLIQHSTIDAQSNAGIHIEKSWVTHGSHINGSATLIDVKVSNSRFNGTDEKLPIPEHVQKEYPELKPTSILAVDTRHIVVSKFQNHIDKVDISAGTQLVNFTELRAYHVDTNTHREERIALPVGVYDTTQHENSPNNSYVLYQNKSAKTPSVRALDTNKFMKEAEKVLKTSGRTAQEVLKIPTITIEDKTMYTRNPTAQEKVQLQKDLFASTKKSCQFFSPDKKGTAEFIQAAKAVGLEEQARGLVHEMRTKEPYAFNPKEPDVQHAQQEQKDVQKEASLSL